MTRARIALINVVEFCIGVLIGVFIENITIEAYLKWDPSKKSKLKLSIVALVELFVVFLISQSLRRVMIFGLLSSLVFIYNYALIKFYDPLENL